MRTRKESLIQFLKILSITTAAIFTYKTFVPYSLAWNITESIPKGIYLAEKLSRMPIYRGDIVCFKYKEPEWAKGRKYFPEKIRLCKYLLGMPGDAIQQTTEHLMIKPPDAPLLSLQYLKVDGRGRPMTAAKLESEVLEPGTYLALAPRLSNSLDSRYLGPIKASEIEIRIKPLWTW